MCWEALLPVNKGLLESYKLKSRWRREHRVERERDVKKGNINPWLSQFKGKERQTRTHKDSECYSKEGTSLY